MEKKFIPIIKTCIALSFMMLALQGNVNAQATATTLQTTVTGTMPGNTDVPVVIVKINVTIVPYFLYALFLSTAGSTNAAADIANAKVFYTGNSSTFSTAVQFSSTVSSPEGFFTMGAGPNFPLLGGDNYFWITYDVQPGAITCDSLDAACSSVYGSNGTLTPAVTDPAGYCIIGNCVTGMQAQLQDAKSTLQVYPNPSNGNFTMKISDEIKNPVIEIFDLYGRKIYDENIFNDAGNEIHIKNISPGMNVIRVRNESMTYIQKIVVR